MLKYKDENIVLVFIDQSGQVRPKTGRQTPAYMFEGHYIKFTKRNPPRWYWVGFGHMERVRSAAGRDYLNSIEEGEKNE